MDGLGVDVKPVSSSIVPLNRTDVKDLSLHSGSTIAFREVLYLIYQAMKFTKLEMIWAKHSHMIT